MAKAPVTPSVTGVTPLPSAPHVYRLAVDIGIGQTFEDVVNIDQLEVECQAALLGRVWSVKHYEPLDAIDIGAAPSTVFDASEKTTLSATVTAHNPAVQSPAQARQAARAAARANIFTLANKGNLTPTETETLVKNLALWFDLDLGP